MSDAIKGQKAVSRVRHAAKQPATDRPKSRPRGHHKREHHKRDKAFEAARNGYGKRVCVFVRACVCAYACVCVCVVLMGNSFRDVAGADTSDGCV